MPSSESIESRLRLTGEVAGRRRTFLLVKGENRIGSMPANDIVLKAPGVSRSHALISVGRASVTLSDLSSKNGTFVNGMEVLEAELDLGDEIAIGAVKLRLSEIDDEDAAMAFVVAERPLSRPEPPTEGETEVARPSGEYRGLWLDLLDRYLSSLGLGGEAALPSALGQLARGLGATAAVLCEWQAREPPVVLAAWGQPGSPGDLVELAGSVETEPAGQPYQFGFREHPEPAAWCVVRGLDEHRGLLICGRFDDIDCAATLLRPLLAAATLARPGRPLRGRVPSDDGEGLVFPDGHVVGGSARIEAMYRELETACKAVGSSRSRIQLHVREQGRHLLTSEGVSMTMAAVLREFIRGAHVGRARQDPPPDLRVPAHDRGPDPPLPWRRVGRALGFLHLAEGA